MPKCDFNKFALLFRAPFYNNTSGGLVLNHLEYWLQIFSFMPQNWSGLVPWFQKVC